MVDDDRRILESLENLLESADHAVRPFASAEALLESRCLAEIDCLISDIDMPAMDGFELLRVVRAARPELPILLITGHPEMMNRLPPVGPGHYRLFKKPFNGEELLMAVVVEQVDLSDVAAVMQLHRRIREQGIAIDILINNAGHGLQGPFVDMRVGLGCVPAHLTQLRRRQWSVVRFVLRQHLDGQVVQCQAGPALTVGPFGVSLSVALSARKVPIGQIRSSPWCRRQ